MKTLLISLLLISSTAYAQSYSEEELHQRRIEDAQLSAFQHQKTEESNQVTKWATDICSTGSNRDCTAAVNAAQHKIYEGIQLQKDMMSQIEMQRIARNTK